MEALGQYNSGTRCSGRGGRCGSGGSWQQWNSNVFIEELGLSSAEKISSDSSSFSSQLGGLVLLGIGIWVKVDGDSFVKILGVAAPQLMLLLHVGYLCMAVGTFLFIMGFLGCWGAVKESRCLLLVFFAVILVIFIAEVVCAVMVLIFSSVTDVFVEHLKNWAMKTLKEDYGRQEDLTAIWDSTMKQLKCCGFNNYADFNSSYFYRTHEKYPSLCCLSNKECQQFEIDHNKQGCLFEFEMFLKHNGKIVGGVALAIGMVELAAMVVSLILYYQIGTKV
ncbi:tetraspanin-16 [Candoia aspera]|uniref:tetraspanin-16 n=1 Tax=Candoia aspera TaxID=51853 RepID=UPI002FD85463